MQPAPASGPSPAPRPLRADAVIAVDGDGAIVFWSAAAQRLLGFGEEIVGRPIAGLFADEVRGKPVRTRAMRADGTTLDVEVESEQWRWREQEYRAVYVRDVSHHDAWLTRWSDAFLIIENLLVEAESLDAAAGELLAAIGRAVGAAACAVWLLDDDGRHLHCRWFGSDGSSRDVEAFRAATMELTLPFGIGLPGRVCADGRAERVDDIAHDERFIRAAEAEQSGITSAMAFPIALEGDVCGVLELSGDAALAPLDGSLEQMMATVGRQFRRVLGRERAVEELRRSRQTYLEAERFSHIGSFERNLATGTTYWSDELYRLFGYEPQSFEPTIDFIVDAVVPEEREAFRERMRSNVHERAPIDIKYTIAHPDGERRVLRVRAMTIVDASGCAQRMVGKVLDVTNEETAARERRELEKQLAQASRMSSLGRLAATMAHEFNNVLMGIETFVKLLERRNDEATRETAISRIQQSLRRGRTVTDEILRFTRAAKPLRTTIDVRSWLRDFFPEALALTDGMTTLEVSGEGLIISGDISQLNQVLANLVLNARDASPRGSKIEITASRAGDRLDLTVTDRGAGIPDDIRERIFEPLFTTKRSGTGLGLAVVDQVIAAHDGEVRVESEMGKGTRFHLLIPLLDEPSAGRRVLPPQVLVVEDDPAVAAGLRALLESEGVNVELAASGRDAMQALERKAPAAIIMDVGLPDMMGTELYDRIEQRWPRLPVIFITGNVDREQIEAHLMHPHAAFLRKPFEGEQLMDALARVTLPA
ncbi:MAG TPA: ATP-binding protein [Thermoanaerobaculia bacterium]|nr:ATP-binding protein [Thermoanaerobaculia bacterium]